MFYTSYNVQKIVRDIKDIEFIILCVGGPYNRYTNTPKLRSATNNLSLCMSRDSCRVKFGQVPTNVMHSLLFKKKYI